MASCISSISRSWVLFSFATGVEAVIPLLAISISVSSSIDVFIVMNELLLEPTLRSLIPPCASDSGSAPETIYFKTIKLRLSSLSAASWSEMIWLRPPGNEIRISLSCDVTWSLLLVASFAVTISPDLMLSTAWLDRGPGRCFDESWLWWRPQFVVFMRTSVLLNCGVWCILLSLSKFFAERIMLSTLF